MSLPVHPSTWPALRLIARACVTPSPGEAPPSRQVGPLPRLVVAILVALSLGAVSPESASAAGSLQVTPNLITMLSAQSQAQVSVSWSTGSSSMGFVKVKVDDSPFQSKILSGVSGTNQPYVVHCCHTYQFTLTDAQGAPIVGAGTVKVKTQVALPGGMLQGCWNGCITQDLTFPTGTYAAVNVATDEPAMILVEASTEAPNPNGTFDGKPIDASLFTITKQTHLQGNLKGLQPNTTYHYILRATDTNGGVDKRIGSFKTYKRVVTVTLTTIHVINDSDPWSDGELTFGFSLYDYATVPSPPSTELGVYHKGDGATITTSAVLTQSNAPSPLKIQVAGKDDDSPEPPELAMAELIVPIDVSGPDQSFTKPFSMQSASLGGDDLSYSVSGTIQVSYVAP